MRLSQWIGFIKEIEAGGEGSGCHGENCGRPAGQHVIEEHEHERQEGIEPPFMLLKVLHRLPLLFDNDKGLSWHWSADHKFLHIEHIDEGGEDDPADIKQTTVYDVPKEIIESWHHGASVQEA